MTRESLTIDRPEAAAPTPTAPASLVVPVPSKRERFAAAVSAVIAQHKAVAAAHAHLADLIEEARQAGTALHTVDSFTGGPQWSSEMVVERQIITELAVALHLSENDTRRLLHTSEGLAGPFTATRAALQSGAISYRHAEKIVHHSHTLPVASFPAYEHALLPHARTVTVQRLDTLARAATETAQPTTAVQRHLDAANRRRLDLDPATDGMAYLTLYIPAVEAVAIHNRATDLARSTKQSGDPRSLTHLRVDTLTDLLLNAEPTTPGTTPGIRARIHVTVPALTLLHHNPPTDTHTSPRASSTTSPSSTSTSTSTKAGSRATSTDPTGIDPTSTDTPGDLTGGHGWANLEGYGPIDQLTALHLTRNAPSFTRVLTDPATGCALGYGRQKYKPPADLDELIRLTHTHCTFPHCPETSATADLDHTIPWNNQGTTDLRNLSPLCSSHHKVKHHTEWNIQQTPDGTITWTSPAGHQYTVDPTPLAPPEVRFDNGLGTPAPF
ncbi:hypothetical protein B7R54_08265 [Subtercola boreus]|uniref:HNH nuclease domain-containing protein n=1 Tax=Subtercola boreus TaxID=120213 RepID=A0A3E0VIK0_9MICO|nr:HNH endonuclease signature motif containing protein [Subtercola boreus]RFA09220.1 hypothetical protein B7R54_08265 [Subtercola boreus]TQL53757.1 uncharacterized protein DUF222 [Subtercola boreus]